MESIFPGGIHCHGVYLPRWDTLSWSLPSQVGYTVMESTFPGGIHCHGVYLLGGIHCHGVYLPRWDTLSWSLPFPGGIHCHGVYHPRWDTETYEGFTECCHQAGSHCCCFSWLVSHLQWSIPPSCSLKLNWVSTKVSFKNQYSQLHIGWTLSHPPRMKPSTASGSREWLDGCIGTSSAY